VLFSKIEFAILASGLVLLAPAGFSFILHLNEFRIVLPHQYNVASSATAKLFLEVDHSTQAENFIV